MSESTPPQDPVDADDAGETTDTAPPPEQGHRGDLLTDLEIGDGAGRTSRWRSILVPVLAVFTALAAGAVIIVLSDSAALNAWSGVYYHPFGALQASWTAISAAYSAMLTGAFGNPSDVVHAIGSGNLSQIEHAFTPLSETVLTATPLILAGLSVAVGFRAGLFNIGAEGQITVGAICAGIVGFSFAGMPGVIHLPLVLLAGALGGAAWGAVPGFLKARTGAHEVITTIMMNYISFLLLDWVLTLPFFLPAGQNNPVSKETAVYFPHLFGSALRVHTGILLALAVAVAVWWLYERTTLGFEFRAVGSNPDAARTAGMHPGRTFVLVMAIAGAIAGLVGAVQFASVTPQLTAGFSAGFGFDAIALALLGRAKPGGVVAAALLFAVLRVGGLQMQLSTQIPIDLVTVIEALVILFVAAPALVRGMYRIKARTVTGPTAFTKGWGA